MNITGNPRCSERFALLALSAIVLLSHRAWAADPLQLHWMKDILTISGAHLPGGKVDVWYLEAFCRRGSTGRDWGQTTIPHQTELLPGAPPNTLRLRTVVEPQVEVLHEIRAGADEVEFRLTLKNNGPAFAEVDWFQPCIRVNRFTGHTQRDYVGRCFIYTDRGLTWLDRTRRSEDAIYRGGQVYVPEGIDLNDVNPRPLSPDKPVNGLIGCVSADDQWLLATAWDHTQELFQGVIVCIHNDPRVGGLQPGETKQLRGKLYLMKNRPEELLNRYQRDFRQPASPGSAGVGGGQPGPGPR